jgi:hypothetical protein
VTLEVLVKGALDPGAEWLVGRDVRPGCAAARAPDSGDFAVVEPCGGFDINYAQQLLGVLSASLRDGPPSV